MQILRPTLIGLTVGFSVVSVYLATVVADEHVRAQDVAQQRREVTVHLERLTASQSRTMRAVEPAANAEAATATAPAPAADPQTAEEDEHGGWSFASHAELRQSREATLALFEEIHTHRQ